MSPNWVAGLAAAFGTIIALAPAQGVAARLTIESGGVKRTAVIIEHEPLKLARRPLVIVLHAADSNGARARRRLGFETIAHSAKPIFLYPDAIRGRWAVTAGVDADRDVAMLRDIIARLVRQRLVNPKMIFLVGDASGGAMAIRAACSGLGQAIAGLATMNTSVPTDLTASCAIAQPFPYIDVSGDAGPRAPSGGVKIAAATDAKLDTIASPSAVTLFARLNACTTETAPAPLVVSDPRTRHVASIEHFSGCKAPVEQVRIDAGGPTAMGKNEESKDHASRHAAKSDVDAPHLIWGGLKNLGA
jgi:polyhydroxybutyrate depolymerase